jgi:hypothetical protein
VDLVEKFGFQPEIDYELPLPPEGKRHQIRDAKHYAPVSKVNEIAAALERGDILPAIIVTRDGTVVDGATRVTAHRKKKYPKIRAVVLDCDYESASSDALARLALLGAASNLHHGIGIDRNELHRAVAFIVDHNDTYDGTRLAALLSVTEATIKGILAEKRARDRAQTLGITLNGSVKATQLRILGQASDKFDDQPFSALVSLVHDTGLDTTELLNLLKRLRQGEQNESAKLATIATERAARREQIATYRASGKARPPAAGTLRRTLGFLLGKHDDPGALVERNPDLGAMHLGVLQQAADILATVIPLQQAFNNANPRP